MLDPKTIQVYKEELLTAQSDLLFAPQQRLRAHVLAVESALSRIDRGTYKP